jgi:hypothetical protein
MWSEIYISHSVVCLTTGPYPLPRRVLHRVRSSASSFNFQYPLVFLRSSSGCLRILPRLPVTSVLPSIFLQWRPLEGSSLLETWPIQLAFLLCTVCRIFLSYLTLCNTFSFLTLSVQLISILLRYHISELSRYFWPAFRSAHLSAPYKAMLQM